MSCDNFNGLEEAGFCKKGASDVCCSASSEVAQVSNLHSATYKLMRLFHCYGINLTLCFPAARDRRSSRNENPDAREAGEAFFHLIKSSFILRT